jgi:hypothetical protein
MPCFEAPVKASGSVERDDKSRRCQEQASEYCKLLDVDSCHPVR